MNKYDKKHVTQLYKAHELGGKMIELMASEDTQARVRRNFPGWIAGEMKCLQTSYGLKVVHAWVTLVKWPKVMVLYGQGGSVSQAVYNALERNYGQLMLMYDDDEDLPF